MELKDEREVEVTREKHSAESHVPHTARPVVKEAKLWLPGCTAC